MLSVAVVDDGSLAIRGAISVLENASECGSVTCLYSLRDLVYIYESRTRTVLVADPFPAGDSFLPELCAAAGRHTILVMSGRTERHYIMQAMHNGAQGYIGKDIDSCALLSAVQAVGTGGVYLGQPMAESLMSEGAHSPVTVTPEPERLFDLTAREREVLAMIAEGFTHRQISTRLMLSKATVDTYVHRIRQKVGAINKAGLTRVALTMGLTNESEQAPAVTP